MKFKIRKVGTSELQRDLRSGREIVGKGEHLLIHRFKEPKAALVPPKDLKVLQYLSKLRPELLSRLFEYAEHGERMPIAAIISWLEPPRDDE